MWCSYNEWTNRLHVYRHLLTNCLHGKAAEQSLATSWNNRVTTTKYIEYIPRHVLFFLSRGVGKVILRRHNQKPFTAYQHFDRNLLQ